MKTRHVVTAAVILLLMVTAPRPAPAFDAEKTFAKGTVVLSGEGSYGWQFNLEGFNDWTKLEFWNLGVRGSILPFNPTGIKGKPLYGSLEIGLEPVYQQYTDPKAAKDSYWAGLAAVFRYHFLGLSFGPVVPYVEVAGAAGGTDLKVREIRSSFSFLLWGGLGASVFVTDSAAVYAGYRWEHNSNGNIESPNRGWESNVAVAGVSYYFH
jgi:hypothetical protein